MNILAIESSCDETAAAVVQDGRTVLSNVVATQIEIHRRFGGVVPEIASRNHTLAIENVVLDAVNESGLSLDQIDAVAVTYGAGLLGALLVGVNFAKGLAYNLGKPLYAISHIRGHLAANYIGSDLKPPYLCMLASGGHTALLKVLDYNKIEVIASSRDDACGEAFDKIARVLGLPYPGGPEIEKLAKSGKIAFDLPKPKLSKGEKPYFSYSGLKTYVINLVHKMEQKGQTIPKADIAASFQDAALKQMITLARAELKKSEIRTLAIAGGVSANGELRRMADELKQDGVMVFYPNMKYCTDNAAMIGAQCYFDIGCGLQPSTYDLDAKATVAL